MKLPSRTERKMGRWRAETEEREEREQDFFGRYQKLKLFVSSDCLEFDVSYLRIECSSNTFA